MGRGGIAVVAATGMSSATVHKGIRELEAAEAGEDVLSTQRIRNKGGGRKRAHDRQPGLIEALKLLVEPTAGGDPESALRWTCKSTSHLAAELRRQGFQVGPRTVARELKEQEFHLQGNRKTGAGDTPRRGSISPPNLSSTQGSQPNGPSLASSVESRIESQEISGD